MQATKPPEEREKGGGKPAVFRCKDLTFLPLAPHPTTLHIPTPTTPQLNVALTTETLVAPAKQKTKRIGLGGEVVREAVTITSASFSKPI